MSGIRLGVNVDHVATVRNARGGRHPDPVAAAHLAAAAGADGITAHLREDRRHVRDDDIRRLRDELRVPLNFEMAVTEEMLRIALSVLPHACCLVPEKRTEVTTEGGLAVRGHEARLQPFVARLVSAGVRVSLFIDADVAQVQAAAAVGARVVELHTGTYAHAEGGDRDVELAKLHAAALAARRFGIECHAGHGLTYDNVGPIAALPDVKELNIGHFLVGEAIFEGLPTAIRRMREAMTAGLK